MSDDGQMTILNHAYQITRQNDNTLYMQLQTWSFD